MTLPWLIIPFFLLGYAMGSIPFGLIFTRLAGLGDIRSIGSGNIGATNVLRTGHKGIAAATLLGDALKGTFAVLIAWNWGLETALAAAIGAFCGHVFSVFLGFKGGKGVATYIGILLGLSPWTAICFAVIWLATALITRYSSAAALLSMALVPFILIFYNGSIQMGLVMMLLSLLSWWRHKDNIKRLLKGEETKIGQKKKEA